MHNFGGVGECDHRAMTAASTLAPVAHLAERRLAQRQGLEREHLQPLALDDRLGVRMRLGFALRT